MEKDFWIRGARRMTDLEKLEYIHSTLQEQINDCNINNDSYLDEMETSLKFVEESREPHFKEKKE